jgi:serine/threonine-protein kinase
MSELDPLIFLSPSRTCDPSEACLMAVPTESDVQRQLKRIGASRFFCKSNRLCRFLSFAANQALLGDGQRLKEVQVGIHVFDRGSAFDPRVDPIVRVEARRLRSKLKSYYASVGRADQLLIDLPKGTYTPVFRFRIARPNNSKPTKRSTIAVLPFTRLTDSLPDESLGAGLTEELIHQLIQIPHLQVHTDLQTSGHDENPGCRSGVAKWKVRGSIRSIRGICRVTVQLIETMSNSYIWSETYDRAIGDVLDVQEGIAKAVVAKLKLTLGLPELKVLSPVTAHREASA